MNLFIKGSQLFKQSLLGVLVFPILLLLIPCAISNASEPQTLRKARLIVQWLPQAQFAGYYTAFEKGFYKKYGIDLEIINSGPDAVPSLFLKEKKADFATMWLSTAVQKRSAGLPLINISQLIQRSSLMLIAKKTSNINTPSDLNNKKVSIFDGDFAIQPKALFRKFDLKPHVIAQSPTPNLFLRGGVDAVSAMWYNEYHTIINSGINDDELRVFFYSDFDLNFPEDGIYVLEDFYKESPEFACAFVRASIEGWQYAFSMPEESIDIVIKRMTEAGVPANRTHQRWMLHRIKDLMGLSSNIGKLSRKDFMLVAEELKKAGLIKNQPEYEFFYRECK